MLTSKIKKDIETQKIEETDIASLKARMEQTRTEYNTMKAAIEEESNTLHSTEAERAHLGGLIAFDKKRLTREQEELQHLQMMINDDKIKIIGNEKK